MNPGKPKAHLGAAQRAITAFLQGPYNRGEGSFHLLGTSSVRAFEKKLSDYMGMRYALATSSGTAALLALGKAINLGPSDEFIVSPYAWGGDLVWCEFLRARPVFADVDSATLNLDPESVRKSISRKTKAILAVEYEGIPADDEALRQIADEHGIYLVVDGARSLGALRQGRPAGNRAHAVVLSFTHGKDLDLGEGGAVLTDDPRLYHKLLLHSQHTLRLKRELGLDHREEPLFNGRIHPLAAILGEHLFEPALERVRQRQKRYYPLVEALNASGLTLPLPFSPGHLEPSFYTLSVALKEGVCEEDLLEYLLQHGWSVRIKPLAEKERPVWEKVRSRKCSNPRRECCPVLEREMARRLILAQVDG